MTPTTYGTSENSGTTRGTPNHGAIYVASDQGGKAIGTANHGPVYIANK